MTDPYRTAVDRPDFDRTTIVASAQAGEWSCLCGARGPLYFGENRPEHVCNHTLRAPVVTIETSIEEPATVAGVFRIGPVGHAAPSIADSGATIAVG